jgi:hypothetical protein
MEGRAEKKVEKNVWHDKQRERQGTWNQKVECAKVVTAHPDLRPRESDDGRKDPEE